MSDRVRETKAYERRLAFLRLWRAGTTNQDELAVRLKVCSKTIQRMIKDLRTPDPKGEARSKLEALLSRFNPGWQEGLPEPGEEIVPVLVLPPDPGPDLDHLAYARSIVVCARAELKDRIKSIEICEKRRQFDILHGTTKGKVNWALLELEDIPLDERPRLFGLLAETMREERAPFLALRETTPAQQAVFFALGLQVHAEDAEAVLAELAPARAAALARAAELTAARSGPPPDITPVDPADYLEHVPGTGGDGS